MPGTLKERLDGFAANIQQLQEGRQPPLPTLHILGRNQKERDWQRFLFHFLSPDRPHGLERGLLRHVLLALSDWDGADFDFSPFDIDDVCVETEVTMSNGGRVDAVIWVPEEWFVCWELKLYSSEGGNQTEHYVRADSFDSIGVEKQGMAEEYLYLTPEAAPSPTSMDFNPVSWEWIASELEAFLLDSHGQFPARTTAQIEDFIGAIKNELDMTEYQENEREKAELYLDYYDEIREAQRSFDRRWQDLTDTWGTQLANAIDRVDIAEVDSLRDEYVAVNTETDSDHSEQWIFQQGSKWGGITKHGWRRTKTDLSPVYRSSSDEEEETYRVAFYHRLELNRELAITDHILELQLWHGTDNPDELMTGFSDRLRTNIENGGITPPSSFNLTGSRGKPLTVSYDIPVDEYEDFFEAYVAALRTAFLDLVVENPGLVRAVDEAFEESLEAVTDTSE